MNNLGDRIKDLRKQKNLSQSELAEIVGISYAQIGRYETKGSQPPAETTKKIADSFGVSLDYPVGEGQNASFDKATLKRLQDVQKLSSEDKVHIYALMDAFFAKSKLQSLML